MRNEEDEAQAKGDGVRRHGVPFRETAVWWPRAGYSDATGLPFPSIFARLACKGNRE
jgi:hypothetical protein